MAEAIELLNLSPTWRAPLGYDEQSLSLQVHVGALAVGQGRTETARAILTHARDSALAAADLSLEVLALDALGQLAQQLGEDPTEFLTDADALAPLAWPHLHPLDRIDRLGGPLTP